VSCSPFSCKRAGACLEGRNTCFVLHPLKEVAMAMALEACFVLHPLKEVAMAMAMEACFVLRPLKEG